VELACHLLFSHHTWAYQSALLLPVVPGIDVLDPDYEDATSFVEAIRSRGMSVIGPVDTSGTEGRDMVVARCVIWTCGFASLEGDLNGPP